MNPNPIAVRVARRHARDAGVVVRDVSSKIMRVDYDCSGSISSFDLRQALEPTTGWIRKLRFRATEGASTTVAWEAVKGTGERITGTLGVRATVTADAVMMSAEVTVEPP